MLFLQGDFHLLAARNVDGYRQYTGDGAGIVAERQCKCFQPDMSAIQTFAAELQSAVLAGKSAGMEDVEAGTAYGDLQIGGLRTTCQQEVGGRLVVG